MAQDHVRPYWVQSVSTGHATPRGSHRTAFIWRPSQNQVSMRTDTTDTTSHPMLSLTETFYGHGYHRYDDPTSVHSNVPIDQTKLHKNG